MKQRTAYERWLPSKKVGLQVEDACSPFRKTRTCYRRIGPTIATPASRPTTVSRSSSGSLAKGNTNGVGNSAGNSPSPQVSLYCALSRL